MSKGKKRTLTVILVLLLLLLTIGICYFLFTRKDTKDLEYDDNATTGIMPGVDVDERRKELQNLLDRKRNLCPSPSDIFCRFLVISGEIGGGVIGALFQHFV